MLATNISPFLTIHLLAFVSNLSDVITIRAPRYAANKISKGCALLTYVSNTFVKGFCKRLNTFMSHCMYIDGSISLNRVLGGTPGIMERDRPCRRTEVEIEAEVKCHRDSGETSISILIEARVFPAAIMYSYGASRCRQARSCALAETSHTKRFSEPLRGSPPHYRRSQRARKTS